MTENAFDPLTAARAFAPEAEEILGSEGLAEEIRRLSEHPAEIEGDRLDVGDLASVASAVIALLMWIDQIRQGQVLRGKSRDEIFADLYRRVLDNVQLSQEVKERLLNKLFDRFPPDG